MKPRKRVHLVKQGIKFTLNWLPQCHTHSSLWHLCWVRAEVISRDLQMTCRCETGRLRAPQYASLELDWYMSHWTNILKVIYDSTAVDQRWIWLFVVNYQANTFWSTHYGAETVFCVTSFRYAANGIEANSWFLVVHMWPSVTWMDWSAVLKLWLACSFLLSVYSLALKFCWWRFAETKTKCH